MTSNITLVFYCQNWRKASSLVQLGGMEKKHKSFPGQERGRNALNINQNRVIAGRNGVLVADKTKIIVFISADVLSQLIGWFPQYHPWQPMKLHLTKLHGLLCEALKLKMVLSCLCVEQKELGCRSGEKFLKIPIDRQKDSNHLKLSYS